MSEVTQEDREAADAYADSDGVLLVQAFARHRTTALTTAQAEIEALRARVAELEGAEDRAWHEARELVRGTNADLCKTAVAAYRVIHEGINNAVNNRQLRTLAGRVKALSERKP